MIEGVGHRVLGTMDSIAFDVRNIVTCQYCRVHGYCGLLWVLCVHLRLKKLRSGELRRVDIVHDDPPSAEK